MVDEHELVKAVHGYPKCVDVGNHLKSVVVDDCDGEEEEDGKVDSGASTSMYQARPSVPIDSANDEADYEVHVVEKEVADGADRSDRGGNASRFKGFQIMWGKKRAERCCFAYFVFPVSHVGRLLLY